MEAKRQEELGIIAATQNSVTLECGCKVTNANTVTLCGYHYGCWRNALVAPKFSQQPTHPSASETAREIVKKWQNTHFRYGEMTDDIASAIVKHEQAARERERERGLAIYRKGFEENWVVQDVIDVLLGRTP